MASSSGNSMTSSEGGEVQQQHNGVVDERKRKRMESNRESARRSRMRKQKHLDDLMAQAEQIKNENHQILQTINLTTQQFVNLDAENSVLKAQINELSQRLQSLNDILDYMNTLNGPTQPQESFDVFGPDFGYFGNFTHTDNIVGNNPWDLVYLNQPIMATADVLQY